MNAAVAATEAIRTWTEHTIGIADLARKFNTSPSEGLTRVQAEK
jgi:hypothetical protein